MWANTEHEDLLAQVGAVLENMDGVATSYGSGSLRQSASELMNDIRDSFIRESSLNNTQLAEIFRLSTNRITRIRQGAQ